MNSRWNLPSMILLLSGALGTPAAGVDVTTARSRPDIEILRAMGSKTLTADTVRESVAKCAVSAEAFECEARLRGVLPRILEESEKSAGESILEGLRQASQQRGSPGAAATKLLKVAEDMDGRAQQTRSKGSERKWFREQVGNVEPTLTAASMRELSRPDYEARLLTYVDQLLPEDSQRRVEEGFEAYVATTCTEILGGRALATCRELGTSEIQRASLFLSVMGLLQSEAEPEVVSRYLSVDQGLFDRVWLKTQMGLGDERLRATLGVVRRWREKRPNRWNAWADLESLR